MKSIGVYSVRVEGYGSAQYAARSPAKARARAWRDFCEIIGAIPFADFLRRSLVRRVPNPPGHGDRIMVLGSPATRVFSEGHDHYVSFMRDDGDVVLFAHPADVEGGAQ